MAPPGGNALCRTVPNRLQSEPSVQHDARCKRFSRRLTATEEARDGVLRSRAAGEAAAALTSRSVSVGPAHTRAPTHRVRACTPRVRPATHAGAARRTTKPTDTTAPLPRRRHPSTGAALTPSAERQRAPFPRGALCPSRGHPRPGTPRRRTPAGAAPSGAPAQGCLRQTLGSTGSSAGGGGTAPGTGAPPAGAGRSSWEASTSLTAFPGANGPSCGAAACDGTP